MWGFFPFQSSLTYMCSVWYNQSFLPIFQTCEKIKKGRISAVLISRALTLAFTFSVFFTSLLFKITVDKIDKPQDNIKYQQCFCWETFLIFDLSAFSFWYGQRRFLNARMLWLTQNSLNKYSCLTCYTIHHLNSICASENREFLYRNIKQSKK